MSRQRSRDPIGTLARRERARRRVGAGATCSACGQTRPETLIAGRAPVLCAECVRKAKGHSTLDEHHLAGRPNHPLTVPVPVNDHRADLSVRQMEWPKATRENVHGSPALAGAGMIRGIVDWVIYILERGLLWIAEMLETLDAVYTEHYGVRWWQGTEVARYAPRS